jgi:alpha-glucosidase (family GH31 glycosyl hydrolase)
MGYSVTGIMGHNIMGIPLAGSDICGFIGDTNPELCARWHMVGAFYPFSRNHNAWDNIPQEPYQAIFEDSYTETGITYFEIMQRAIFYKYDMIRYYYTELSWISITGGAFYKPLFFEFPSEAGAYENQELNIMLGSALKLGIQSTTTGVNTTDFYFPEGLWCDVFKKVDAATNCITSPPGGSTKTLSSFAYDFYLHLRGGYMVPMQDAKALKVKTSQDLKVAPFDLHVLPVCDAQKCAATGRYLNDDGISVDVKGAQNIYTLTYTQPVGGAITLTVTTVEEGVVVDMNDVLGSLQIYNAAAQGLNTDLYNVVATKKDATTIDLGQTAAYDAQSDRLMWKAADGQAAANLPEIDFITLTAA